MNIRDGIAEAVKLLAEEPIGPPRMAAETLMMYVLGRDRSFVIAHPEQDLSGEQSAKFTAAVRERASGKPLQYITGHQEFWGLDLMVTPAVLIPRPETEHLVESALGKLKGGKLAHPRVIDVGTGSGCIALALASELPSADVHAVDISEEALDVARRNAERLGLKARVRFLRSDLLAAVKEERFDLVISNPPYVGRKEWEKVQREVREHEPDVAVFAGDHGIEIYGKLIPQAYAVLNAEGWLMMEIGYTMEAAVLDLLNVWRNISSVPDLQGIPRVVMAQKA
ncbi:MAG TPA: peptide chain release factor N(5)-glutamine methyltransferase [Terriglobales bacterium]|nr:peptide chain release factor N(5)-glutamine methyltransferase [Terriglobales bacterium]